MPCSEIETDFGSMPVVSFWDSTSCLEDDWRTALCYSQKQFADASLLSLPEELASASGNHEARREFEASLASIVEILPLASPKHSSVNCEKFAWGTPCQSPETCPPLLQCSNLECSHESENIGCAMMELEVALPQPRVANNAEVFDDPIEKEAESQMPRCLSNAATKFQPPSRRASSRRPTNEPRATAMVPMLRAQHMDLLDAQYLNDPDVKMIHDQKKRPPSCAGRIQNTRARQKGPADTSQGDIVAKISPSNGRPSSQTHRQLGPNAIMPVVKGRLQIQAAATRSENLKEARDARLREQFRSKLSAVARSKSEARNSRARSSSNKRTPRSC